MYSEDNDNGETLQIGAAGYADEMPTGWDNRARSIKCSKCSVLNLYSDNGREGAQVRIDHGVEKSWLGAVLSAYIYVGTYGEEEDTEPGS